MKGYILIGILFVTTFTYSSVKYLTKEERKEFIQREISLLKKDKVSMEQFYFIGKLRCYEVWNIGKKSDREGAFTMFASLEYPLFSFLNIHHIETYFKDKYSKEVLAKQRVKMHFGINEKFGNPKTAEHLRAFLTCETLNRLNDENILKYQNYIDSHKLDIESKINSRLDSMDNNSMFKDKNRRW